MQHCLVQHFSCLYLNCQFSSYILAQMLNHSLQLFVDGLISALGLHFSLCSPLLLI